MNEITGKGFQDCELTQRKLGNATEFRFSADELKYTLSDKTSSTTFKTPYVELTRDHGYLVERNSWLMNVGLLWIAIGAVQMGFGFAETRSIVPSFWLLIGAGCAAAAWLRTVRYTKIPASNGTLFVIDDAQKPRIIAELETRRVDQLRRWHDFIDASEDPQRQRGRLKWLHDEGALSEAELAERLARLNGLIALPEIQGELLIGGDRAPGSSLN